MSSQINSITLITLPKIFIKEMSKIINNDPLTFNKAKLFMYKIKIFRAMQKEILNKFLDMLVNLFVEHANKIYFQKLSIRLD